MGVVVQATHTELGQQVALKVLHDELATNPNIVARFLREAKAVATLRTEHVCRVFDVGRLDSGAPFIVMEMLDGTDLSAAALTGVPMTIAVEYVIQACVALAEAHAAGLVHRDIKPPNLFVVRKPDGGPLVKVLDFGIAKAATAAEAKLTHTTSTMGSPGYMSPEQIRSTRDVDLRTDIWALGVTLYQLLTGRMPFGGTQLAEIAVAVMTAPPPPLQVDPTLAAVVMRCLEKEPEKRFANVAELAAALMPFGGPSAPRFVREITRGAVGGDAPPHASQHAPPQAPIVPVHAPTAAGSLTGVGVTGPMLQRTSVGQVAPHATVAPARKAPWIAIGIVLVVVLVGGGALAGYLARGNSATGAGSSAGADVGSDTGPIRGSTTLGANGGTTTLGSNDGSTTLGSNDGTVAMTPDASTPPADASDPWSGHADPIAVATTNEADDADEDDEDMSAMTQAQLEMARSMLTPAQKKEVMRQLTAMEKALAQTKKSNPSLYQQQLVSLVTSACYMGDVAMAQRAFANIDEASAYRQAVLTGCKQYGVTLHSNAKTKK